MASSVSDNGGVRLVRAVFLAGAERSASFGAAPDLCLWDARVPGCFVLIGCVFKCCGMSVHVSRVSAT